MGGCRLLYFAMSKKGTKCKNFAVLLCFYVNAFILLYFLKWQEEGATTPLNPPLVCTKYNRVTGTQSLLLCAYQSFVQVMPKCQFKSSKHVGNIKTSGVQQSETIKTSTRHSRQRSCQQNIRSLLDLCSYIYRVILAPVGDDITSIGCRRVRIVLHSLWSFPIPCPYDIIRYYL